MGTNAVVIGAGMAGLTAAKALTAGFSHITVCERDRFEPGSRRGVPQDRHLHLLLPAGAQALEALFPGLGDELVADGAMAGETDRIRMCLSGHRLAPASTGERAVFASRPFLESHVRRRLLDDPAVTLREGARVTHLASSGDRIVGVTLAPSDGLTPEVLPADVLVDCSGRHSALPRWIRDLGYQPPVVEELRVDVHYTTLRYRLSDGVLDGDHHVLVAPTTDGPIGGAMTHVEDGTWIVTLFAMAGESAPPDVDGFERFAARLPIGDISDALRTGEPLGGPARYRFPANRRYRYEKLDAFPTNLLAAGDAVCAFNPIYGQGMTVAALQARILQARLGGGLPEPRTWYRAIAGVVNTAWQLATAGDLAVRAVESRRGLLIRMANRYLLHLHAAATRDPSVTAQLIQVAGLVEPPTRLLQPGTVARVLRAGLRRRPR